MLLCFSGKDCSNLKYDALEGNCSQFFSQHKTRHPFRCRGTACTVDIYQHALRHHPSPRSTFVKTACSVDIYQRTLRNPSPFIPHRKEYLFRRYLPACPAESPPPVIYQRPAETPTVSTRCKVIRYSSMPRIWHPVLSSISRLYKRLSIDPVARSMSKSSINRLPLILNIPLCVVKAVLKRLCKELTHDVAAGGKRSSTEL